MDVVYGETRKRALAERLIAALRVTDLDGTLYVGYPVLASADDRVEVDALVVSRNHGLIAFQLAANTPATLEEWRAYGDQQDRLFGVLDSNLRRHDGLRRGRRLALDIETVTVFPDVRIAPPEDLDGRYCTEAEIGGLVEALPGIDSTVFTALEAALQRVTTIKPAKRRLKAISQGSRGSILKRIESHIANLDQWQKRAAIETPEGPQRIRGLAGSGKTIVLALKAAYLHAQNPTWDIVLTFQSQALYQQLEDLVTRFSFEHSNDQPDFSHLAIMHAWGSRSRPGLYQRIADALDAPARDFNYASNIWGREDAFKGACAELLTIAKNSRIRPIFDSVLIDEAQDLPPEFFQLVWLFTKEPKRIAWGYDELQRLSETAMPSMEELFGTTRSGESLVQLFNHPGQARQEIVLPICYRNTPWSLAVAHALGFGIYSEDGLVQHFDEPISWEQIGYEVRRGSLVPGREVSLRRSSTSYPEYFSELLQPEDAVAMHAFTDQAQEDEWIADSIATNVNVDEIDHDDILIVLPSAYTAKRRAVGLAAALNRRGLKSHLVGVNTGRDEMFVPESIAMAHIYRAKGNEAPMVYVVDAQYAVGPYNEITRRNTLFTAITRSRAWVRICGYGAEMQQVVKEFNEVITRRYSLDFTIPTSDELALMRRVNRDRSQSEVETLQQASDEAARLLAVLNGKVDPQDLPPALREELLRALGGSQGGLD